MIHLGLSRRGQSPNEILDQAGSKSGLLLRSLLRIAITGTCTKIYGLREFK